MRRTLRTGLRSMAVSLCAAAALFVIVAPAPAAPPASAAPPTGVLTPAQVVEIDRALDGSVIELQGEAIGESLRAHGGGRWINLLGDGTAIGVWMTEERASTVRLFGDHLTNGDVVRVTGVVNISCEQHGGEFDVHASSVDVLERGGPRDNPVQPWKGVVGLGGLLLAFGLWRAHRARRDRRLL